MHPVFAGIATARNLTQEQTKEFTVLRLTIPALVGICLIPLTGTSGRAEEKHAVFANDAVPEPLWTAGEFTEGVAVRSDGLVFFSDIPTSSEASGRILVFDPATGKTAVHSHRSGKSNGLCFDSGDRLLACCGANNGLRALCEVTESGDMKVLVSEYRGRPFNAPNDLVVHPDGCIYFTDPRYIGPEPMSLDGMWVYRFDPASRSLTVATKELRKPNGIETSPDGRIMYIAETDNGATGIPGSPQGPVGQMQLTAFDVAPNGSLSHRRVLADFGKETGVDGMTVDDSGRIFAAVRAASRFGIAVFDSTGRELDFLKTDVLPTNCHFGAGNDAATLYVTAGGGLYRVAVKPVRQAQATHSIP